MCATDINHYLENNQNWVKSVLSQNKEYFDDLKEGQQPKALLLGCSDSRVSPSMVLGMPTTCRPSFESLIVSEWKSQQYDIAKMQSIHFYRLS